MEVKLAAVSLNICLGLISSTLVPMKSATMQPHRHLTIGNLRSESLRELSQSYHETVGCMFEEKSVSVLIVRSVMHKLVYDVKEGSESYIQASSQAKL